MKVSLKLYRTVAVLTEDLLFGTTDGITPEKAAARLKEDFYPFSPRFKVFWGPMSKGSRTVVGMEAQGFDLTEAKVPMSGMVLADPMDPVDVARLDGALEGELNRLGLTTEFEGFEWRWTYEVTGN